MSILWRTLTMLLAALGLAACTNTQDQKDTPARACLVSEARWVKPPEDSAVQNPPAYSHYFVNEDQSIWASASWAVDEEYALNVSGEWIKVAWFRPAGTELLITGQRLDGEAPPLDAEASCCYPTRFQASGLYFPAEGCWQVTAKANDRELSFIVWIEP